MLSHVSERNLLMNGYILMHSLDVIATQCWVKDSYNGDDMAIAIDVNTNSDKQIHVNQLIKFRASNRIFGGKRYPLG